MKNSIKRTIVLVLCALLVVSMFAGCGKTETPANTNTNEAPKTNAPEAPKATPGTEAPPPEDDEFVHLTLGVSSYLGTFITGGLSAAESCHACDAVFDSVWFVDPKTSEITSNILTDWHWEDDTTLVMTLRDDIVFSNGDKATGEDLLYSFTSLVDRGAVRWVANMRLIPDQCELRDTYTVALKVEQKDEFLFTSVTYLYNKKWAESVGWESLDWFYPIGSGPYYVKEYEPESRMLLGLRDEYWRRPISDYYVDEWEIIFYANPTTMYMALEIGEIDMMAGVNEADYARFLDEGSDVFDIVGKSTGVVQHFSFGYLCNECWQDKRVRQAVAYGVPWDEFGKLAYGAMYYPATSFATHDSPLYENVGRYEYDLEKAQALLKDAGYEPGELHIVTYMMDTPANVTQGEALKYYLDKIGFDTEVVLSANWGQIIPTTDVEFGTHYNVRGSGTLNPTASLNLASSKALPFLYIDNEEFQELYAPLATCIDKPVSERLETAKKLQHLVHDECLNIPITEQMSLLGYRTEYLSGQQVLDCALTSSIIYLSQLALKENYMK